MALTKNDIVTRVHELGFTKVKSVEIIESLLEIIKSTLEKSEDVLISGFGKFCVKHKKQRRGRNPATGADLMLSERKVVTFKCSGKLRNQLIKTSSPSSSVCLMSSMRVLTTSMACFLKKVNSRLSWIASTI